MRFLDLLIRKLRLIFFILLCLWVLAAGFLEPFRGIHAELASFTETVGGGE
jgi:hypothetical protein